jgi:hypothetical protein
MTTGVIAGMGSRTVFVLQRVGCVLLTIGGLYLTWTGLWENVYFEATHEALEEARLGRRHLIEGAVWVLVAAGWTIALSRRAWPAVLMALGAALSGGVGVGLSWVVLAVAVPLIVAGLCGGLVPAIERRGPADLLPPPRFPVAVAAAAALVTVALLVYGAMALNAILA